MSTPTAAERAEWREKHRPSDKHPVLCWHCYHYVPCPTRRLLDALEAAEADLARGSAVLRAVLSRLVVCSAVMTADGVPWCWPHNYPLPCPVGAARALLGEREGA